MKRLLLILLTSLLLFSACNDWLDVVPEEDITTIDTDFETRAEALNWLETCYAFVMDKVAFTANEAFIGADELVYSTSYLQNRYGGSIYDNFFGGIYIATGLQNSLDPYNDIWLKKETDNYSGTLAGRSDYYTAINLCNIFISKIDQVYNMDKREKMEWKAEVKALKAYYYFDLVRHYGPIILVPENIDPNVGINEMKVPRSHVDSCFKAIVTLCDQASDSLPALNQKVADHRTFFSKEAVLALKARALLYQASDLFNGNPDYANFVNKNGEPLFSVSVSESEKADKWRRAAEAAETAIAFCLDNGKDLVKDRKASTKLQSDMLNIENSVLTFNYVNDEVLWMTKIPFNEGHAFYYSLPKLASDPYQSLSGTVISPSLKMVEMFYTENGLPIDQDKNYAIGNVYTLGKQSDPKYVDVVATDEEVLYLHTRREPRFYACIAADRCFWRLGSTRNSLRKVMAYQGEDFGLKSKRLTSTVPENLSGYWMKKWSSSKVELSTYETGVAALGTFAYPMIRLAELYLIAAEAWNECGELDKAYKNINVIRQRAGIPDVQVSWKNARQPEKVNTKEGMREIIRQEWNIEFAFEGMRYWNLRRWKTAPIELNTKLYGWVVTGNNAKSFYNNGRPVEVKTDMKFVAPRDYFWPIRSEEVTTSGCVQNLGW